MRTSAAVAALALAFTGLLSAPAAGESPRAAAAPPDKYIQLISKNSAKCADVEGWSTANGGAVHQWSCRDDDNLNQLWYFAPATDHPGYYHLVNRNSYKCMDVEGPSYEDGAKVHQWECYNGPSQAWRVETVGGTWFRLVNYHSGKCLDVEASSTADGARIHQWGCLPSLPNNQPWRYGN
ncbi:RICIN domain-containing protein [Streptomyces sp. NPDC002763]|uniref:RICIN domain-containing protein n=1 Tax=Streptomyces sp. NPDC002763 TaxID=3154427 RepID=UPI00331EB653